VKNYFRPVIVFTKANILRFFRDKVYIFFMLVLPVMFLLIFGMIYSNDFASFKVAIFNNSPSPMAEAVVDVMTADGGVIVRAEVPDRAEAEGQLVRSEINAIVELPADFGVAGETGLPGGQIEVVYGRGSEQVGQAVAALMNGIATELNTQVTGQSPSFTVEAEVLDRDGLSNFDYVFAGLLGYTVLTIGLMGIANVLPGDKESGATKRLRATTVKSSQLIFGYALTFLALGVLTFGIMVALGLVVFDFNMRGSWLAFAAFATAATVMMMGFGIAVGGWAKNEAQASALANLIMFPMMFLSGVFFPLFMMPELVQSVAGFIPLTPIVEGIRLIITENYSLLDVAPQLGLIAAWGVIIYAVAIKTFRWE